MKKVLLISVVSLIFILISISKLMAVTVTLSPSADGLTYSPSGGDGNSQQLVVGKGNNGSIYQSALKFSLSSIPSNAIITSAKLKLFYYQASTSSYKNVYVYKANSSWSESNISYGNPGYTGIYYDYQSVGGSSDKWEDWDVTNLVSGWVNGSITNNGMLLRTTSSSSTMLFFRSSEYSSSSKRPKLEITYTTASNPNPTVSNATVSSNIITLGDYVDFTVYAKNLGGDANIYGSISVSYPELDNVGDANYVNKVSSSSDSPGYEDREKGEQVWNTISQSMQSATCLLTEWGDDNWKNGETNYCKFRIYPQATGTFYILYRVTMKNSTGEITYPSSSIHTDQQGFKVNRITITVNPPQCDLSVTLKNANGSSTPIPGTYGDVLLYDNNWNFVDDDNSNSSGVCNINNIPYGTYNYEVYHDNGTTIFGNEYWGTKSNINLNSVNHSSTFTRNMPYVEEVKVYANNIDVTSGSVSLGTPLQIRIKIKNINSSIQNCKPKFVLDRDKTLSYDYSYIPTSSTSIYSGLTNTYTINHTPSQAGDYYGVAGVYTLVNGNFIITDGHAWNNNPLVTISSPIGNLNITLKNADGSSVPLPGANATVKLYDNNWTYLSNDNSNSSGICNFNNLSFGTYYYEAYHNDGTTIFGSEFWGGASVSINSSSNSSVFTRHTPYIEEIKVFANNVDVTSGSVPLGTPMQLKVKIKNISPVTQKCKPRLILDLDKSSSYDFDQLYATHTNISSGLSDTYVFNYTPNQAGDYYSIASALTEINNSFIVTDGHAWNINPIISVIGSYYTTYTIKDLSTNQQNPGNIKLIWYDNPQDWNQIKQLTSSSGLQTVYADCPVGVHPIEIYDLSNTPNEFWGSHLIGVPDSTDMKIAREAPYEIGLHRAYIDTISALNQSTDPSKILTTTKAATVGQKIYIPVTIENPSYAKNVKVRLYVNDNQSYTNPIANSIIHSVPGNKGTKTFVFVYTIPSTVADGTTLSIDVKVEAEYNSIYKLVDSYNGWEDFKVTTDLPEVIDQFPDANAQNVPVSAPIEIYFSTDMLQSTVEDPNNWIISDGTNLITASYIDYHLTGGFVIFQPSTSLIHNTTYTVTLKSNVKSLSGVNLDGNGNGVNDGINNDDFVFQLTTANNVNEVRLEVPYKFQAQSSWCWATSASMLVNFFGFHSNPWDIAKGLNKGFDDGLHFSTEVDDLEALLEQDYNTSSYSDVWKMKAYKKQNESRFVNEVVNVLNNGSPVFLQVNDPISYSIVPDGHVVLITGYKGTGLYDSVFVHDPSDQLRNYVLSNELMYTGLTWQELISYINFNVTLMNVYDAKIIYSDKLVENHKMYSIQIYGDKPNEPNRKNSIEATNNYSPYGSSSLIFVWDGTKTHGYKFIKESISNSWHNTTNTETEYDLTRADRLTSSLKVLNYSLPKISNTPRQIHELWGSSFNLIYSDTTSLINSNNSRISQTEINDFDLANLNAGSYISVYKVVDNVNALHDSVGVKFYLINTDYAGFDVNFISTKQQNVIQGNNTEWEFTVTNKGNLFDAFNLLSINGYFTYAGNTITITPPINPGQSINLRYHLTTSNMAIGSSGTENLKFESAIDNNKNSYEDLSYTIIGCSDPIVDFNLATDACTGDIVSITDLSTNVVSGATYEWDIDNDGTSEYTTVGDITHTFPNPLIYTVKLTVDQNNGCSASTTKTIDLHEVVADAGSTVNVCDGEQVTLTGTGGQYYQWSDGIQQGVSFTPSSTNTYTVTVTDLHGCFASDQVDVNVHSSPTVVSQPTVTDASCGNSNGSIIGLSVSGSNHSFVWKDASQNLISNSQDVISLASGTYTVVVTDQNNCSVTSQYTVNNGQDFIDPIAVTKNIDIYLDVNGQASIVPSDIDNGSSDNCNISNYSIDKNSFSCIDIGPNMVTLTVTDGNNNSNSATATVTVIDNNPPSVQAKDFTIYLDGSGQASITANDVDNGSSVACGSVSLSIDKSNFTCSDVGANTVTLSSGTKSDVSIVTVLDTNTTKVIAKDITIYLDGSGQASITANDVDNGSSVACGSVSLSIDKSTFTCSDVGANTVTLSSGTKSDVSIVTVLDTNTTKVLAKDITIYLDGSGQASITTNDVDNGSSVACGSVSLSIDKSNFTCSDVGANTVTLSSGTKSDVSIVTVLDTNSTKVIAKDITIYLDGSGQANITANDLDNGSSVACGSVSLSIDKSTFTCSDVGANTVTLSSGTNSDISIVTVVDTNSTKVIAKDITIYLDGSGQASITSNDVDNGSSVACGSVSLSIDKSTFTCSDVGANTVTLSSGTNSDISIVTVVDTNSTKVIAKDITIYLDGSGQASITSNDVDNGSSVACGSVSLSIDKSNFTCSDVGANTVTLSSGTKSDVSIVTVLDTISPTVVTASPTIYLDVLGQASITTSDVNNGSTDNCGVATMLLSKSNFTCSDVGANTINLTVTDVNGNIKISNSTVTVLDTSSLVVVAKDITIYLGPLGQTTITPSDVDGGSINSCGSVSLSIDKSTFTCSDVGANTVTLSSGTKSDLSIVTVVDTNTTKVIAKDITIYLDGSGQASITTNDVDNGSSVACGSVSLSIDKSNFTCSDVGANTVTLSSGTKSDVSIVTVLDTNSTKVIAKDITIFLDGSGQASITSNDVDNGSSVACGSVSLSIDKSNFTCGDVGANTVTLSSGTKSDVSIVTVLDTMSPVVVTNDPTIYLDALGQANITTSDVNNGSTDNCGIATMLLSKSNFTCSDIGTNTITLTVTDVNGNIKVGSSIINVFDTSSLVVLAHDTTLYLGPLGQATLLPADIDDGSYNSCGSVSLSIDKSNFTCSDVGTNTVTLSSGTKSDVSIVTVVDTNTTKVIAKDITIYLDTAQAKRVLQPMM
jgi:hypothetical protein